LVADTGINCSGESATAAIGAFAGQLDFDSCSGCSFRIYLAGGEVMGALSGTGIFNDGFGGGADNSFDPTQTILGTEQLVANTFLANQAITSPRPATVQLAPNGTVIASGGGANSPLTGATSSWGALLSNPLVLILLLLFGLLIFRK
jgi:hypothetical protein